jgi:hypothetical protein
VVLAASSPPPAAAASGALELLTADGAPRLLLPDPRRSAAAVHALLGLQGEAAARPDGRAALASVLRAAEHDAAPDPSALLAALTASQAAVAPASEQQLGRGGVPLPAVPLTAETPWLDYPFVALSDDAATTARAADLLRLLQSDAGQRIVRENGLRGRSEASPATSSLAAVDAATRAVETATLPSRLLAVVDVSASMAATVGDSTRLRLTADAAQKGLDLYPDETYLGLWAFSTRLTEAADHRELVPLGPLAGRRDGQSGREKVRAALSGLQPVPGGGTGLYDTVRAAVETVRAGWDPSRANSVVLLTDGYDDDRAGISLDELVAWLRSQDDPERPVPVVSVVLGPDGDIEALEAISRATGGATYVATSPEDVGKVFLDAVGRRACLPQC